MPNDSVELIVSLIRNMSPAFRTGKPVDAASMLRAANHKKIAQIARLEDDWNGNGAGSFSSTLIDKVSHLIDSMDYQPEVFPTACDSIQFEYDTQDGRHLEIEISEQKNAEIFIMDQNGQEYFETISSDATSINRRVTDFIERHI